jgi:hydroxymethylbilane synthase
VGVHSELVPDDYSPIAAEGAGVGGGDVRAARLRLVGTITAVDGGRHVEQEIAREVRSTEEVEELGAQLARALVEAGGREILDEVAKDRERRSAGQATGTEVKNVDAAAAAARETAPLSQ